MRRAMVHCDSERPGGNALLICVYPSGWGSPIVQRGKQAQMAVKVVDVPSRAGARVGFGTYNLFMHAPLPAEECRPRGNLRVTLGGAADLGAAPR
jgi:hypothetical protein